MATQDLGGGLGRAAGLPVVTQWRWYYNVPGLPLWIVLLLLVVAPRHNRQWQAWLILLLPLLAAGFSWLIQSLTFEADNLGQFITALAIAWTCVWLLAPWLQRGNRVQRLLQVCAVLAAVGVVAYLGFFGAWVSNDITWPMIGGWAICSLSLVAAAGLTGLCCRGNCGPLPLLFWPVLWLPVAVVMCVSVFVIIAVMVSKNPGESVLETLAPAVLMGIAGSVLLAGALYILDLPVLLLRMFSPVYRDRFRGLFGHGGSGIRTADAAGAVDSESVAASPFRV